ncbi:HlyD family type I secretion periplasmic adaptor subunit [Sphingomonas sp.]|jgi:HlyD family secretion protein|uniref:HlyD family type I secretion periplasmic adaptor subunit n=1 Tax=Sphingomonas sp. TaxID=28214 RepID=UPI002E31D577|nr:HlyD family type I secretion periplasmic adaptor subunit [Sphingomonas sp.]HEX4694626.1 HlyD family type I secretion periplasmic adaptor subunit [Sphingomonas sp.]
MFYAPDAFDDAEDLDPGAARLRRRTRRAYWLIAWLVIGGFGLAALLQIGGAVVGSGEVAVESSVKTIAHPTGGILSAVLVRDGDHVAKGQVLMRLDQAVSSVGMESASLGLEQLRARRARLEAERDGAGAILFPGELTASSSPLAKDAMVREQRLFDLRRRERDGSVSLLGQRVKQYEDEVRSYQAQIDAIEQQMVLVEPELAGLRKLHDKQLVTINRLNEMERTAVQMRGSKAALESNIAEARARISEAQEQMLNVDKQMRSEAATQLAEVVGQLNDQQLRVATANDTVDRSVIRAPQSGTVDKIAFLTVGSAVPAGQPILQIVPDHDNLLVDARIRPQDVDQVRLGQTARVTFSGLNRQTTPDIPGVVSFLSPDLTSDQKTGQSFYRIKVRLDAQALAKAPQIALKSGMPAEVFVETNDRSILSYLFKPLFDQIRYAMRGEG